MAINTTNTPILGAPFDAQTYVQLVRGSSNTEFITPAASLISSAVNIEYADLYNKVVNGELTPGQWYRLTDYKSVNFLNGYAIANANPTPVDPNFNPQEIYEGDAEVLLLQATSPYEIAEIGYSETFEGDIVQYEPYTNKIGLFFDISNGNTLPDSTLVSGFDLQWDGTNVYFEMPTGYPALFGHGFYLYANFDGGSYRLSQANTPLVPNISKPQYIEYPNAPDVSSNIRVENNGQKIVLLDLTYNDFLDYDVDTLYVETDYALGDAYGWISRRIDTYKNIDVPFDFRGRKYRRFECEMFGDITGISYVATGNTATDGIYVVIGSNYTTTSVEGVDAQFRIKVVGGVVTEVTIFNPGRLYVVGDTFTIDGTIIGGTTGVDDIVITVDFTTSVIEYIGQGDVFNGATTTGNFIDVPSINYTEEKLGNIKWEGPGGHLGFPRGLDDNTVILGECGDVYFGGYVTNNTFGNLSVFSTKIDTAYNTIIELSTTSVGGALYQNTIYSISDCNIGPNFGSNFIANPNNQFYSNTIGDDFYGNTMQDGFYGNTIGTNFGSNVIGNEFNNNRIGSGYYDNNIGDYFAYNQIGSNFSNNIIADDFGFGGLSAQGNIIGNNFSNNVIGEYFYNNRIVDNFTFNTIADDFQLNDVKCSIGGTDFTSATHVYGLYNCDIFLRSDSSLRLSYIDNTDTVNYTNIDA